MFALNHPVYKYRYLKNSITLNNIKYLLKIVIVKLAVKK